MQVKIISCLALLVCATSAFAATVNTDQAAIEYVKVCDVVGAYYYYIPGTDTCINASTGTTVKLTEAGNYWGESQLSLRITQLENQLRELQAQLDSALH